MYRDYSLRRFLDRLSGPHPTPGGGSATCLVGAIGISLALMVGRVVEKKRKRTKVALPSFFSACLRELSRLNAAALRAVDGDVRAYKQVVLAYALSRESPGRHAKIERALQVGYHFQKHFAELLLKARKCHRRMEPVAGGSIASDLILSKDFLQASFKGAVQTARINLECMKDGGFKKRELKVLHSLSREFRSVSAQ